MPYIHVDISFLISFDVSNGLLSNKISKIYRLTRNKLHRSSKSHLVFLLFALGFVLLSLSTHAQDSIPINKIKKLKSSDAFISDTLKTNTSATKSEIVPQKNDSLRIKSVPSDTSGTQMQAIALSKSAISSIVNYFASDSIRFDLRKKQAYLYNKTNIKYEDIVLESNFVRIDMNKSQLFATGIADSMGVITGKPLFKQGTQSFRTEKIEYNFISKKGLITSVITQEGEGFMHGEKIKKNSDSTTFVYHGKFTTCDNDDPHFELAFTKAKVVTNNVIVTGPAYLKIQGIPTPLALPFGFFPNKKGRKNGLIIPSYGNTNNRGFYFENGGFYWGVSDNLDIAFIGDIYTRGSWAAKIRSNYKMRYKYSGNINMAYANNILGEKNTDTYQNYKDFMLKWVHVQDPKAHPVRRFSADVNIMTSKFKTFNPTSANDYLSNTFQSAVTFSTSFNGKYFLSANLRHSQNTITRQMNLTLPEVAFSVNRFYPFRRSKPVGALRWYENISMSYQTNMQNNITGYDSTILSGNILDKMQNGIKHTIPISNSMKLLKYFNWTNTFNYNERWYFRTIEKHWDNDLVVDSVVGNVKVDTINGFKTARDFNFNSSINTRIYGMYRFGNGYIKALRHVVSPSVNFTYCPDFTRSKYGYYHYYYDKGVIKRYSIFDGSIYGTPPANKQGQVNFSIANNLEMKVKGSSDTVDFKKIVLVENLTFSTAVDFTRDSMQWVPLSISGRTTLFKNLYITYNSTWDPYYQDTAGVRSSLTEWKVNKRLFRLTQSDWNFSLNWSLNPEALKSKTAPTPTDPNKASSPNFSIPWNLNISYNLNYLKAGNDVPDKYTNTTIQTLSVTGELNLTKKWKISASSGYDFKNKEITYTSIDIYRDLHCWEMRFNWIPIGTRTSWNFTINVKASVLQDLKYVKKKDFRDAL